MKIDYDIASKTYDNTREINTSFVEILSNRFDFTEQRKVLDFGCGTGNYLNQLSQKYKCTLFGLEPSEEMRSIALDKNKKLSILSGNHESIPFDNCFFNLIYMTDVIHHVPDLNILFANLYNKLDNNGFVCILTESHKQIETRWYNKYFKSLVSNEKNRYPDIIDIIKSAEIQGFELYCVDILNHGNTYKVTSVFVKMVEEKNYSMFRQLSEAEYQTGLKELRKDLNRTIPCEIHGESIIWLVKKNRPTTSST